MRRVFAALSLVVLAAACSDAGGKQSAVGGIEPGSPSLLEDRLSSLRGKPVVVNYWATWCTPCKEEMPRVVAAAKRYEGRVSFLGVNVQDDLELAAKFAKDNGMTFPSIADADGKIRQAQKLLGLPVTQFYLADGDLAFNHQGEIKVTDLEDKIEDVLRASR